MQPITINHPAVKPQWRKCIADSLRSMRYALCFHNGDIVLRSHNKHRASWVFESCAPDKVPYMQREDRQPFEADNAKAASDSIKRRYGYRHN